MVDAKQDHQTRKRISIPKELRHVPISTDKIKVKNDTSETRRLGEVLEIDNEILIDIVDPEHLWQLGIAPTLTHPFGILRKHVKAGQIEELQVSGVCKALVNMLDITHQYASVKCGVYVLESSVRGPVRILYQPDATGEQECIVLFTGIETATIMEGELADNLCPGDAEASVVNCKLMPDCTDFEPVKVTNTRRHSGEAGAPFSAYRKKCKPTDAEDCETAGDEEWVIFDIELRDVCFTVGIDDRESCLVAAALKTTAEWCPAGEPTTACTIVTYTDCDVALDPCETAWAFTPLFACCGQAGDTPPVEGGGGGSGGGAMMGGTGGPIGAQGGGGPGIGPGRFPEDS